MANFGLFSASPCLEIPIFYGFAGDGMAAAKQSPR
jgi:hypothetical protein